MGTKAKLIMKKLLFAQIEMGVMLAAAAFGQTPNQALAFEVVSVRPSGPLDLRKIRSGQKFAGMKVDSARLEIGSSLRGKVLSDTVR